MWWLLWLRLLRLLWLWLRLLWLRLRAVPPTCPLRPAASRCRRPHLQPTSACTCSKTVQSGQIWATVVLS